MMDFEFRKCVFFNQTVLLIGIGEESGSPPFLLSVCIRGYPPFFAARAY